MNQQNAGLLKNHLMFAIPVIIGGSVKRQSIITMQDMQMLQ